MVRHTIGTPQHQIDIDAVGPGFDYTTITVPILRTSVIASAISVTEEVPSGIMLEALTRAYNLVLQRFLEANQDKILLETVHFHSEMHPLGQVVISIPSIRAVSIEYQEYIESMRTTIGAHYQNIVFPRLVTNARR